MRKIWLLVALSALLLALLAFAWIDGGREPVRPIVQPIPVPELQR